MYSSSSRLDNEGEFDDALTHQDDRQNDVGENFEEPKDLMAFISDEELSDKEENVVLPVVLKDIEKVEESKESMTFSSIEEVCSYYRRLRNVFWADAWSRAAYDFFGDVITFDTTYLTNRYDMPFAPFVGVNHHGQSILLGAGLISSEDTDTFVWLFKCWLECMNGQALKAIMTDQDRAMKNAIAISAINKCLYDSQTCEEYEENSKDLLEKYNLHDNAWLNELYMDKTFWVPAYMKDTFWTGMNTTQRSESMKGFFDGYVHSRTTLKEFVDEYDNGLRRMVESETHADFDSFNRTIPCISALQLEKQFQVVYTNAKFKEVHEQFVKMMSCNNSLLKSEGAISTFEVVEYVAIGDHLIEKTFLVYFNDDELEVKCTCALFEVRGILCRHSLSVLRTKKVTTLPQRYVLDRWRKDIKREYSKVKSSYDQ
ncbi:protein FAR1-RELATED SEQUENCE 5-like [Alnus glutinosa]|uniref:protein FAR1-RELATED SEQUENCE 5-like n=1 Tax=Alnus glutinosa TaxID=3517 RepID=UPI002D76CE90|nr:protein FAR1-RELATED SEQUENCE 5-like [Alnus glutinosa]